MPTGITPRSLADALVAEVEGHLAEIESRHLPGFRVPRVFAGHRVGADVAADLAFTLGLLAEAGGTAVAGCPLDEALVAVLRQVDGARTHTFFSYRVAETLLRRGPFEGNALLAGLSPSERENLREATDSSAWIPLLDRHLPRNYAAVLARCELARRQLGLTTDDSGLEALVGRVRDLLGENPHGFLDDSRERDGRYDAYTADVYLFLEPLAEPLGPTWEHGARNVLRLVERVAATNGAALVWGRSTGVLAVCLTVELGALALARGLAPDPARWLGLAAHALACFPPWMRDGIVTAHQHRSPYAYRGPQRRLQLTFDVLGKLAWAAATLRRAPDPELVADPSPFPERDDWVELDERAGVWSHLGPRLAFVLPCIGGVRSDYLPAPVWPGLLEVPVDAPLATGVPAAYLGERRYVPAGRPEGVEKSPGGLRVRHQGFLPSDGLREGETPLAATRTATYRVQGRTLHVEEELRFEAVPEALAIQVAEAEGRPLAVRFGCATPHRADRIDVSGLSEARSFWGELVAVHQLDLEPARELRCTWSVTPKLRVATTARDHHYVRSLYAPLADRVVDVPATDRAYRLDPARLERADAFHLHWPEWSIAGGTRAEHERLIERLKRGGVSVVWTQHNLRPHFLDAEVWEPVYRAWAGAADLVLHQSQWGRKQVEARYRFRPDAVHAVVPHGHFGNLRRRAVDRARAERELGLGPCRLRIGIVGAPREQKDLRFFLEAFAACSRRDLGLAVWSLAPGESAPDDPRIHAEPYAFVEREIYDLRLAACDLLALPFQEHGMLATGTAADAVGYGLPALVSDWPFLAEYLGEAGIAYGRRHEDLVACLESLDPARVAEAARAARALQARYDWGRVAEGYYAILDEVVVPRL